MTKSCLGNESADTVACMCNAGYSGSGFSCEQCGDGYYYDSGWICFVCSEEKQGSVRVRNFESLELEFLLFTSFDALY
jgi:hypothetical protein